jgi:predicted RNA-binding protein Jag
MLVDWIHKHKRLPMRSVKTTQPDDALEWRFARMISSIRAGVSYKSHPLRREVEKLVAEYSAPPIVSNKQTWGTDSLVYLIHFLNTHKCLPSRHSRHNDEVRARYTLDRALYNCGYRTHMLFRELEALLVLYKPGFVSFEQFWELGEHRKKGRQATAGQSRKQKEQVEVAEGVEVAEEKAPTHLLQLLGDLVELMKSGGNVSVAGEKRQVPERAEGEDEECAIVPRKKQKV